MFRRIEVGLLAQIFARDGAVGIVARKQPAARQRILQTDTTAAGVDFGGAVGINTEGVGGGLTRCVQRIFYQYRQSDKIGVLGIKSIDIHQEILSDQALITQFPAGHGFRFECLILIGSRRSPCGKILVERRRIIGLCRHSNHTR